MGNTIREGKLNFIFDNKFDAIKFDEQDYYKDFCSNQPFGKGVDIIAYSRELLQIIEIKNCIGHEKENEWRIKTNNMSQDGDEFSFDTEISLKIVNTVACLVGAQTYSTQRPDKSLVYEKYWNFLESRDVLKDKAKIIVILHLEGDFDDISHARNAKSYKKRIRDSIRKKLDWLKCDVVVPENREEASKWYRVEDVRT